MTAIKERPILFSAPMVRAILDGRKTVTRRALAGGLDPDRLGETMTKAQWAKVNRELPVAFGPTYFCPYGQVGERLWVRETTEEDEEAGLAAKLARYSADRQPVLYRHPEGDEYDGTVAHWDYSRRSRPSIHMPRWACRILLEITDVRVERLQEGDGETALESRYIAEGINRIHHGDGEYHYHAFKDEVGPGNWNDPFDAWRELWVSVNGAESWNANPWVWVVEFKRVQP